MEQIDVDMRDVGGSENQHSNLLLGFMPMVYSIKPLSMLLYITLVLGTADGSSRADRVGRVVEVKVGCSTLKIAAPSQYSHENSFS